MPSVSSPPVASLDAPLGDFRPCPTDPHHLGAAEASRLFGWRQASPAGLTRTLLDRAQSPDPQLNAFLLPTAARLDKAGGVLLGKPATHESAHAGPSFGLPWPPARDPWNTGHFTGGSSSGSGAAVAARLPLADRQFETACVAVPAVEAMTTRLRRPRAFREEPANTFQHPR